MHLASANVRDTFETLRTLVHGQNGRVLTERLDEREPGNPVGTLEVEIPRTGATPLDQMISKSGQVITRVDEISTDTDNTVDSKVLVQMTIGSAEQLPPRQSTDLNIEVTDVQKAADDIRAAALASGGRQVDNPAISQNDNGFMTATVRFDLPLDKISGHWVDQADGMGNRKGRQTAVDTHAPEGQLARGRLTVTFATPATLAGADDSIWAGVRRGLGTSLRWLSISLTLIVIGLCVVIPWALVVWGRDGAGSNGCGGSL